MKQVKYDLSDYLHDFTVDEDLKHGDEIHLIVNGKIIKNLTVTINDEDIRLEDIEYFEQIRTERSGRKE